MTDLEVMPYILSLSMLMLYIVVELSQNVTCIYYLDDLYLDDYQGYFS